MANNFKCKYGHYGYSSGTILLIDSKTWAFVSREEMCATCELNGKCEYCEWANAEATEKCKECKHNKAKGEKSGH